MPNSLIGASVWEQSLYEHLTTHEENERQLLHEYQQAAADSRSPAFRYLVSLIIDDEIRHHRLFQELADSLRNDAEMHPEEPPIPRIVNWGPDPAFLVELSERLARHEQMDLTELRRIRKEMDDLKDTTLWVLLVRLMELDTEKHIAIAEFVKRHAKVARS